jgi:hypothetical protein
MLLKLFRDLLIMNSYRLIYVRLSINQTIRIAGSCRGVFLLQTIIHHPHNTYAIINLGKSQKGGYYDQAFDLPF